MKNNIIAFVVIAALIALAIFGIIFAKNKSNNDSVAANSNEPPNTAQAVPEKTSSDQNVVESSARETDIILFYGSTCPHCKKVEEYINANKITNYIKFKNLEVYNDKNNAKLMTEMQGKCSNLSDDDKGAVPFLYSSQTCLVGDQPIIDYLKQQAAI